MTIKEFDALNVLIDHAQRDISYGEDGSYCGDLAEMAKGREGIKYLLRLVMKKQHQLSAKGINRAFASGKIRVEI